MLKRLLENVTLISLLLMFGLIAIGLVFSGENIQAVGRTYTIDADFDEGILVGVEYKTVHDQLQLSKKGVTLPFIWAPNQENTVSKVDTETGKELGRYRTCPKGVNGQPSRTTVDLEGNVWLGNRHAGTVVKVGLYENGMYVDRNGNGIIETSIDVNGDGDIKGDEMLPWGEDECVLFEIVLVPGDEGTYSPGEYTGSYQDDWAYPGPRSIAVDAYNNVWVGCHGSQMFYYINGTTGEILRTVDVSPWGHNAYGAVIDENGVLWSSGHSGNHVLRLNPSTDPPTISKIDTGHFVYGLGLDYIGHLFASGWEERKLSRIDITTATKDWTYNKEEMKQSRGVVCTSDNDVWIANSGAGTVTRYDNDGNLLATISVGNQPAGVAVDTDGKVWVCNLGDEYIKRIDPVTNTIDLSKTIIGSGGHYSYSDMTGIISGTITARIGNWTVIHDSGLESTPWGIISWSSHEPEGTSIKVRVRSSNDQTNWSVWEEAENGVALGATPNGRYLQARAKLQIISGDVSPVLFDLTVQTSIILILIPERKTAGPGDAVVVHVFAQNAQGIAGGDIVVTYDKDLFDILRSEPGDFSGTRYESHNLPGEISLGIAMPEAISDVSGSLVDLIFKVREDVSDQKTVFAFKEAEVYSVLGETIPTPTQDGSMTIRVRSCVKGDVNYDGQINVVDVLLALRIVVGLIIPTPEQICAADVNSDGKVRSNDAILIFNEAVGLAAPELPTPTVETESQLLTRIIAELENLSLTPEQKHVLEQLKPLIGWQPLPSHTTLLQNYPNPFNPETWFPYKLAQDSYVTIRIYNTKCQLIRMLHLGNQKAGIYMTKEKAAYWDGRDSFGEKIASGVYYYTLQAGELKSTRKMVIMK